MFKILKLDQNSSAEEYSELYKKIEVNDPYFLIDFIKIFNNAKKNLICFVYESNDNIILLPGYLNEINFISDHKYFDFISPYGYTGPYMSKETPHEEITNFWRQVDEWHCKNNVVSEFIRFNLFGNEREYTGIIIPTMYNVKGVIIDADKQWLNFEHKVRKNVKRALKENLQCRISYNEEISIEDIQKFYEIYIQTMQRTNAQEQFFYSYEDFYFFVKNNPENSAICNVYFEDRIISSEFVLVSLDSVYSFLGGTNEEFFNKRPNDYLKYEVINWAQKMKKKWYILGGGYGKEDGIFNYKKAFFPNDVVNYFTGRKIVNAKIYKDILEAKNKIRMKQGLEILDENDISFFPLYNKND